MALLVARALCIGDIEASPAGQCLTARVLMHLVDDIVGTTGHISEIPACHRHNQCNHKSPGNECTSIVGINDAMISKSFDGGNLHIFNELDGGHVNLN